MWIKGWVSSRTEEVKFNITITMYHVYITMKPIAMNY